MQQCSKCGRTYESDTQKFCTHDGGRLVSGASAQSQAPTTYDLNQTVRTDPFDPEATVTRMPDLNKTVVSAPTSEIRSKETGPATPPPSAPTYQPPQQPQPPPPTPAQQQQTVAFNPSPPTPPSQPQQYYQPPPAQPQPPQQHQQPPPPVHQPQPQMPPQQMPPQQYEQYAPVPHLPQQHGAPAVARKKSSRAPLIIGLIVILLLGGAAAWYFLIYKKQQDAGANTTANANTGASANTNVGVNADSNANTTANANTNTTEPPPPPNATKFVNSKDNLSSALADKFSEFSFYYPNTWGRDPKSGINNFVRVERMLPPDFTQENFTVSWYKSKGTFEADSEGLFSQAVELAKSKVKNYPEFKVVSEGETTVNGIRGHEFRFQGVSRGTEKGDITLWGRVIFLPPGREGETNGVQLLMLTTSLAPELSSADDVGVKGELPVILNSFRMGRR
ncbi:MAG TPA: hypothetical protein VF791_00435 [Pyrinomonadaceae bacterium]